MPSIFNRRARSMSAQRPQQPTSNSAHLAATQAFLANRVSQGNLSASAAAAALRAMSPPPTDVADTQTKRTQRRSSSAGQPNAPRGRSRGGLDRKASSGSMTERTFRTPSPARSATATGPELAPPVPKLPEDVPPLPSVNERRARRSASLDTFGNQAQSPPQPRSVQQAAAALSTEQHRTNGGIGIQRTDSRNSINFSYPRPQSPPPQSPNSPKHGHRPLTNVGNGISAVEANKVQYSVSAAAEQPVKKKKKKVAPRSSEGSHLHSGGMGGRAAVHPLEPGPDPVPQPAHSDATVTKKKKKAALTGQSTHFPHDEEPVSPTQASDASPDQNRRSARAAGVLTKQPSVVREDWEGEQAQEKSEAQLREERGQSPLASPAVPVQSKKLTAANMSRKIEDPATPPPQSSLPGQNAGIHHAVTEAPAPTDTQHLAVAEPKAARQSSLSPSRSTRFSESPSDLASGRKHEPLPRSVSPVKSALKHHSPAPADSRSSENHQRGPSITPSDASDSNISADGSMRRRKSVRVSFEPEPEVVGIAAEPQSQESPVVASPQNKDPVRKGGFFGFGKSRPALTTIPSEDDLDEHMKPRPQLPSFGSVRDRNRRPESSEKEHQPQRDNDSMATGTSPPSSIASSSPSLYAQDEGVSSDHAVGAILAQNAASNRSPATSSPRDPLLPLPPVVTSVEGAGYVSDTESEITVEDQKPSSPVSVGTASTPRDFSDDTGAFAAKSLHEPGSASGLSASNTYTADAKDGVPALAIQPPTPGNDEDKPNDEWLVAVPGGFPSSVGQSASTKASKMPAADTGASTTTERKSFGPSQTELKKSHEQTTVEDEQESSDNDSIYSDAEEELSDREGFGSIDAIVESPILESSKPALAMTPPQSPLSQKGAALAKTDRTASWDNTQQHWSGIAQQTRQTNSTSPDSSPILAKTMPKDQVPAAPASSHPTVAATQKPKVKKQKNAIAAIGAVAAAAPPTARQQHQDRVAPVTMRQSMRQQGPAAAGGPATMRTSMRQQAAPKPDVPTTMRSSMRQQQNAASPRGLQASKWATPEPALPTSSGQNRAALQKKHIPATGAVASPKPAIKAKAPVLSNDSDSDSSFKKARKPKGAAGGGFTMRTSMRAPAQGPPSQPAGRGAVRSLSPPVRRPFSPGADSRTMRTSMRGSTDAAAPTLRQPSQQKRSSSLFGRRKNKSPAPAPLPLTTGIRSRLADSDDEDGPRPTQFRSRFADSSDEEDGPRPLRPVRGIPRRADEGDSTDLDDSSDEERKRAAPPAVRIDTKAAQAAGPSPDVPLSPNTMKKKGLFSRFRGKKDKSEPTPASGTGPGFNGGQRPGTKDSDTPFDDNMGFGSSAERDAMIRETMAKLEAAKQSEPVSPARPPQASAPAPAARPTSPTGGKLQRRRPERVMSDSWPLPDAVASVEDRPSTANPSARPSYKTNGTTTLRPGIGERRPTTETLNTDGGAPGAAGRTKKKRFTMLRKAFGLKD